MEETNRKHFNKLFEVIEESNQPFAIARLQGAILYYLHRHFGEKMVTQICGTDEEIRGIIEKIINEL